MTIEEIIKVLKKLKSFHNGSYGTAIDLAIKLLEQQTCEDCISREEALKVMCDKCPMYNCVTGCSSYRHIEKMPSVTPSYNSIKTELKPCDDWRFYYNHGYAQAKRDLLCEDCISREAVIDIIDFEDKWLFDANGHNANTKIAFSGLKSRVKALPSVTPQETRWIPVSERLPEDGTWNLFTDGKTISVERYKFDAIDHFFPNGRWFSLEETIAWMPLPEPYRESEDK